ncbi:hypothetical protein [Amycolatopsis sp. NPDC003676]
MSSRVTTNQDGLVEIYLDDTYRQLDALGTTADTLHTRWQAAETALSSAGKLGNGPMGAAFQKVITAADKLHTGLNTYLGEQNPYRRIETDAREAVRGYEAGAVEAADQFGR